MEEVIKRERNPKKEKNESHKNHATVFFIKSLELAQPSIWE